MATRKLVLSTFAAACMVPAAAFAQEAVGALQNHQAHMTERTTAHDCNSYYRSFAVRNRMPTSRRMHALRLCRQRAAELAREREALVMADPKVQEAGEVR